MGNKTFVMLVSRQGEFGGMSAVLCYKDLETAVRHQALFMREGYSINLAEAQYFDGETPETILELLEESAGKIDSTEVSSLTDKLVKILKG